MNSMEFNKIAGATIGALLLFLLLNFFSGMIYGTREVAEHVVEGEDHGPVLAYAVAIEGAEAGAGEEEPQVDLLALFQNPDVAEGEKVFRACGACHGVEPGANKVGPTLYDVVGADVAAVDGYSYSDAMASVEGDWTPEHLFTFLENPQGVVPGTKMSYAGLKDPEDRVDVIAYLNQLGDTPVDLTEGIEPLAPAAAEGGAEGAAAGAEGAMTEEPVASTVEAATTLMDTEVSGTEVIGEDAIEGGAAPVEEAQSAAAAEEAAEGLEVTDVTVVDTSDENVEVESVTPMEVGETDPLTTAEVQATDPVEQALTETPAEGAGEANAVAPAPAEGGETVVAAAQPAGDAEAGEKLFRRCQACHKLEEGRHGIGPSLYGVVGSDVASAEGFSYSDAMAAHEGTWTVEELSAFLENPMGHIPGTKMAFAGLKDEQDRIDVITYLQEAGQ